MMRKILCILLALLLVSQGTVFAQEFKKGDRGDEVKALQQRLIELNCLAENQADGIYGERTKEAIAEFQRINGLEETGEADEATIKLLEGRDAKEKHRTLSKGDTGDAVKALQEGLIFYGFMTGKADGDFGKSTQKALEALQEVLRALDIPSGKKGTADHDLQTLLIEKRNSLYQGPLNTGNEGEAVKRMQSRLIALGYMDQQASGEFDDYTRESLAAFQRASGITALGQANQTTWDALFSASAHEADAPVPHMIQVGDQGLYVRQVREQLIRLGFLSGVPSNRFDEGLSDALSRFKRHGSGIGAWLSSTNHLTIEEQNRIKAETSAAYVQNVKSGSKGDEAYRLQRRLASLYYLGTFDVDGKIGKTTMEALKAFQKRAGLPETDVADEITQEALYSKDAPRDKTDYLLKVSLADQRVYACRMLANGTDVMVRSMICSSGLNGSTPEGIYRRTTTPQHEWHHFKDYDCWAQYTYIIRGDIMFHSVLYSYKSVSSLRTSSLTMLGQKASHGCMRLKVRDAKWIFEHCAPGTIVVIAESFDI